MRSNKLIKLTLLISNLSSASLAALVNEQPTVTPIITEIENYFAMESSEI